MTVCLITFVEPIIWYINKVQLIITSIYAQSDFLMYTYGNTQPKTYKYVQKVINNLIIKKR